MKHLYVMRHGLSLMNKAGLYSGRSETPLAPEGLEQARQAGEDIINLGLSIQKIVASPFSRAHDTARIIADVIGYPPEQIELNSLFIERDMGVMEGQPWSPDLDLDGMSDVETRDTLFERCRFGYEFLQTIPEDVVLVVSHGATCRMLRHVIHPDIPFMNIGDSDGKRFPNAKIIQLL